MDINPTETLFQEQGIRIGEMKMMRWALSIIVAGIFSLVMLSFRSNSHLENNIDAARSEIAASLQSMRAEFATSLQAVHLDLARSITTIAEHQTGVRERLTRVESRLVPARR